MNEVISKAVLSGLGFASLTGDAIRQTAQHLVKQSRLTEEEGRRVVEEFQRRAAKTQKTLEKKVHAAVRNALKHLEGASPPKARSGKASAKSNSQRGRKQTRTASKR
jgi:polyhydroxyalkanoate synthesis regulator phasin